MTKDIPMWAYLLLVTWGAFSIMWYLFGVATGHVNVNNPTTLRPNNVFKNQDGIFVAIVPELVPQGTALCSCRTVLLRYGDMTTIEDRSVYFHEMCHIALECKDSAYIDEVGCTAIGVVKALFSTPQLSVTTDYPDFTACTGGEHVQ